jgi:predicted DNA binding CopG/RHH family protein
LKNYDFESLPELNSEQVAALRRVSKSRHEELKSAVEKRVGRPKKASEEKENIVSIRFSNSFLDRIKRKAKEEGYTKWQTYAKHILEEQIK